jgi:hypothetical protein
MIRRKNMINLQAMETGVENLDNHSRAARALIGAALIAFVMTTPEAPLGWFAVLPLLAIYPIFSAITGWDPIKALFLHTSFSRKALHFTKTVRFISGAIGVAMVGSVYVASYIGASMGVWIVLPIVGIYPMFAAISGMDPITALYNLDRDGFEADEVSSKPQSTVFGVIEGSKSGRSEQAKRPHPKAA